MADLMTNDELEASLYNTNILPDDPEYGQFVALGFVMTSAMDALEDLKRGLEPEVQPTLDMIGDQVNWYLNELWEIFQLSRS
jgi:hypothetical protein